jgi:uncharacterized protein
MKPVFADTVYFLALLSSRDQHHDQAVEYYKLVDGMVTSEFVLMEVAGSLAAPHRRGESVRTLKNLEADPAATIVAADAELFAAGVQLYTGRPDKEWSLTDCTSFVLMNRLGLTDALTADHHFEQAGFVALLK